MTTLNEAPFELQQWIKELDGQIGYLNEQRDGLMQALALLGGQFSPEFEALEKPAKTVVAAPKVVGQVRAKPAPKAKPVPGESKYDYARIAEVAHAAALAGTSPRAAVRTLYPDITDSMTGWVMTEARRRGFTIAKGHAPHPPATKPRPVPSPAAARRNWSEIAKAILELREAGEAVAPGLVKIYKVPESTARNWMARCREMGLVAPIAANLRIVEDNTVRPANSTVFDADVVAETYREAVRAGRRPVQTIVDRFDVGKELAQEWVTRTRAEGKLPPAGEPQLPASERRALLDEFKPEPVA